MSGIKLIADNRKARFDFEIMDTYEAGIALMGSEVKSLRAGHCTLKDAYVSFRNHEAFLQNAHIPIYKPSSYNNHEPERLRKLLLHDYELNKIAAAIQEKGLSCVPLKVYFKKGRVKVEIGLGRGKKKHDKRDSIKKRDVNRELQKTMRRSR
ncbi:MAG: SsrA-binding protein SmpB [Bdellovibrionales bacterium]|nr:SsrA-binding protein SmpB [Bdellovibrionales bacterium]